jgi:prepilin-type N-terminal cleavage/methylation domain-containing protein
MKLTFSTPIKEASPALKRAGWATLAMTLPEMMVAIAVGSLMLAVVATVFGNSIKSFALMGNYVNMDRDSRNALDRMTREIRRAGSLTSFAADKLVFTKYGATNFSLVYQWDANAHQLTEWKTGNTKTNILLTDCDEFTFAMQKASGAATTSTTEGKKISVTWKCSRTMLGKQFSTEEMQQALIVVRNKLL